MKNFYVLMNQAPDGGAGGGAAGGAPNPAPTNAPTPTPTPSPDWTTGLNDDLKGYVQNKGFKDPAAVLDSYRNLEKLRGVPQERLLTLPEKDDAPEWAQIHERLGKPKTAEEYKFELPEGAKDEGFEKWVRDTLHSNGISKKAGEAIMKSYSDYFTNQMNAVVEADKVSLANEVKSLQKEWGAAYEQNSGIADRAAAAFGMDEAQIKALGEVMGRAGAMKFLYNIGSRLGEGQFVTGGKDGGGFGILTPAAAMDRINALKRDPDFSKRYLSGEVGARDEMKRLHAQAYPGNVGE